MQFQYPLQLNFKLIALAPRIYVRDAAGKTLFYVHQKTFKLKEDVRIYSDDTKSKEVFRINADRIIDFSAQYHFTHSASERRFGSIKHKGFRSIWKATYILFDANGTETHHIAEDNPWVKVADALLGEIPFVGLFTGYLFHPSYTIKDLATEAPIMKITKNRAFFESNFTVEAVDENLSSADEARLLLGLIMMVQLERSRG
jgi:uncharacterized protein YxjI